VRSGLQLLANNQDMVARDGVEPLSLPFQAGALRNISDSSLRGLLDLPRPFCRFWWTNGTNRNQGDQCFAPGENAERVPIKPRKFSLYLDTQICVCATEVQGLEAIDSCANLPRGLVCGVA
jgi:hypothetical protein